jgi:hypothetical protein
MTKLRAYMNYKIVCFYYISISWYFLFAFLEKEMGVYLKTSSLTCFV